MMPSDLLGAHPELIRQGVYKGVDLKPLIALFWGLDAMGVPKDLFAPPPIVKFRAYTSGTAWGDAFLAAAGEDVWSEPGRIILRLGPDSTIERAVETLLHEIVHCSLPDHVHDEHFKQRLVACAREAFGLDLDTAALLSLHKEEHTCQAYAIDEAIVGAMVSAGIGARLRESPEYRFEPKAPEEPEVIEEKRKITRAARMQERSKKRAAHALNKLNEWEGKMRRAKRHAAKWRTRVRYYNKKGLT